MAAAHVQQGLEEVKAEREERRGLEARAGTLLAAGAGIVGLLASALSGINVSGAERDAILVLFIAGTAIMLISLIFVARALSLGMIRRMAGEQPNAYAERIRAKNETMVQILGPATLVFALAVAFFLAALLWAAWASAPASKPTVNVVVKGERGATGPQGPRGRTGRRGSEGGRGPIGPSGYTYYMPDDP